MTTPRQPLPGAPATPGLHIPAFRYGTTDHMVTELLAERTQNPQGLWLGNTVQPTWEVGRRHGLPMTSAQNLNISSSDAYATGPAAHRRWFVVSIRRAASTGATRLQVRPKSTLDTPAFLGLNTTSEEVILVPWGGLIIENDGEVYDGGALGLSNAADGADTSIQLRFLYYEQEM
jgi:hypothetical protein